MMKIYQIETKSTKKEIERIQKNKALFKMR